MRELMIDQAIFIGFKADKQLRETLAALDDANKKYVSAEGTNFLRICGAGDDLYVGKLVNDRLTTDRVEDIRRNILSIIRKLGHDARLPSNLQILGCGPEQPASRASGLAPSGDEADDATTIG